MFRIKWFRGLKHCMPGAKAFGSRCKIINLRLVREWIRHHARRFHINLRRIDGIPTLMHYFSFGGPGHGRWAIKLHGGAKFYKKKYLYLPGTRGSYATFRRIPLHGSFTISFYIKPLRVRGRQTVIGSWAKRRWLYKLHLVNGRLGFWLRRGPKLEQTMVNIPAVGHIKPNRWYNIAVTWNAETRYARIFVNGKQVGAEKSRFGRNVKLYPNPGRTALGYKQDGNDENLKAYMVGLRISQGVVPKHRFVIYANRIKNFNLKLGGFKYITLLRENLRHGGLIFLKWFRRGRKRMHKCPRGTRRITGHGGIRCRVINLSLFYHWVRRHGPRFNINVSRLPRPRFYHFAPGTSRMHLYIGFNARGGVKIRGGFTSAKCRNWCARVKWCRAVDYNGQSHRCYYHRRPYKRIRATRKSSGTKEVWKIAQYAKISRKRTAKFFVPGFSQRYGDCPGKNNIAHYTKTNVKFCAKQCWRLADCETFIFVSRGKASYCLLKNSACKGLVYTNNRNYHFYNKIGAFQYSTTLKRNFRKGGIIRLRWFRLNKCMPGTKRIGKSKNCRVFNVRFFRKWIRRNAGRFRINLRSFQQVAVAVPKHLVDLALHKPAMQFDTAYGGVASRAVDGVINQNYGARHCTCTNVNTRDRVNKNWWAVDLSRKSSIHTVVVYNRADCCGNRLANFDVVVSDRRPAPGRKLVYSRSEVCAHKTGAVRQGGHEAFRCQRDGRYVAIVQSRANYLTLCEVEVLGYPSTEFFVPGFSQRYGDCPGKNNIAHYTKTNVKFCAKQCWRLADCETFIFVSRGKASYCLLKNSACKGLVYTNNRNYHFYNKIGAFQYSTTLKRNFRKGGIIRLRWFRLNKCMPGTKRIGKSKNCRVFNVRFFRKWIRRNAGRFRINLRSFQQVAVAVPKHLVDLALHKPAMQFDTAYGGVASRVVDGVINQNYGARHCTCTNVNTRDRVNKNWWAVDLSRKSSIHTVVVYNRADCCGNRLANFDVVVSDRRPAPGRKLVYSRSEVCAHKTGAVRQGGHEAFRCQRDGRYVAIVQSRANYLTLCEVEVLGYPSTEFFVPGFSQRYGDCPGKNNIAHYTKTNVKFCAKQCWRLADCETFIFVSRGKASYCLLKNSACKGLVYTNNRNYHFYNKIGAFQYSTTLKRNFRKGGIIRLRWFRLNKCMPGTKRIGKSKNCRVFNVRFFRKWIRRNAGRFRINLRSFQQVAVAVPKHLVDLALHKPAMQFDTAYGGVASRAVDGVINQNYGARHCTCTNVNTRDRVNKNWWAVDLSRKSSIHTVVVYNRADCCGNRLANFDVVVSDRRPAPGRKLVYSRSEVCAHKTGAVRQGGHEAFRCQRDGRYVAIVQSRANYLTLCEVEVLGYPSTEFFVPGFSQRYGDCPGKNNIAHYTKTNVKFCAKQCWRLADCETFIFVSRGKASYCLLKNSACKGLVYTNNRNYHFYNKIGAFQYSTTLKRNFRKGGIIRLRWFRLNKCMPGTKRIGKSKNCRVFNVRFFRKWIRRNAGRFRINLRSFQQVAVAVPKHLVDLALHKPAMQFDTAYGGVASRAVDGVINQNYGARHCTCTNVNTRDRVNKNWWAVDLSRKSSIHTVVVYNRADCCGNRLANFDVVVSDRRPAPGRKLVYSRSEVCAHKTGAVRQGGHEAFRCQRDGRYVAIVQSRANYLTLCEVEVLGYPSTEFFVPGFSQRYGDCPGKNNIAHYTKTNVKFCAKQCWRLADCETFIFVSRGKASYCLLKNSACKGLVYTNNRNYHFYNKIGAFQYSTTLKRNFRKGGIIRLRWFRLNKCMPGTKRIGKSKNCRVFNVRFFRKWIRRNAGRFRINLRSFQQVAVAVPKHLVDLALHKPAMQFDTAYGGVASRAVDGVINQNYGARHCTCTNVNTRDRVNKNWWAVDLSRKSSIHTVVVYNRADCCGNRLANFDVVVSDRRPAPGRKLVYSRSEVCAHKTGAVRQGGHEAFRCQRDGRYVAIVQSRANYLTLCEVEVLGYPSTEFFVPGFSQRYGDCPGKNNIAHYTKTNVKFCAKQCWRLADCETFIFVSRGKASYCLLKNSACKGLVYTNNRNYHFYNKIGAFQYSTTLKRNFRKGGIIRLRWFRLNKCMPGTKRIGKSKNCRVFNVRFFRKWIRRNAGRFRINLRSFQQVAVAVPKHLVDLALHKPAMQFDTAYGGVASRAVDGVINQNYGARHCTCTNVNTRDRVNKNWWAVDLSKKSSIHTVVVYNRADCCGNRLANFDVVVSDRRPAPGRKLVYSRSEVCAHKTGAVRQGGHEAFRCQRDGRYVAIVQSRANYLTLCEVEVLGYPSTEFFVPGFSQRYGDCPGKNNIAHYTKTNVKFCAKQCWRLADCETFIFVSRGKASYCLLKNSACKGLVYTNNRNYHFYNKIGAFQYSTTLKRNFRKGGIIRLRWFRLNKCMPGTKRIGKSKNCRVFNVRFFRKWIRRNAGRFRINLRSFQQVAVAVPKHLVDLALHKPAMQFDTAYGGVASRAVDGVINQNYGARHCTCTNVNTRDRVNKNWWAVDLSRKSSIHTVVVYNRADCCGNRLANFDVVVSDRRPAPGRKLVYSRSEVCAHKTGAVRQGGHEAFRCQRDGRYVAIVQSRANYLTLCEVEVLGYPSTEFFVPGFSQRYGDCPGKNNIAHYTKTNVKFCAKQCWRLADCETFIFVSRGKASYCLLKNSACKGLVYTNNRNYHFYNKIGAFQYSTTLKRNFRKGGIIRLRWFRLNKCMPGTKRIGKSKNCRVFNVRFFRKWIRRNAGRFRINLRSFQQVAVAVPKHLVDLALHKPAMQFDTAYGGVASRAVDGVINQNYGARHCTCTNVNTRDRVNKNWWAVDLSRKSSIHTVVVYNRADCCGNRLANFDVVVSDRRPAPGRKLVYSRSEVCAHKTGAVRQGGHEAFRCQRDGRYVAIVQSRANYLTLCEVEVLGYPSTEFFVPGFSQRYGDCPGKNNIAHYTKTNVKFCAKQCWRLADCETFIFVSRGKASYCLLKNSACKGLVYTNNRNYHFYNKIGAFQYSTTLKRNFRKGGIIRLRWFRLNKCMPGTKRIGKSKNCRVFNVRFFRKWIRRNAGRFRINLRSFQQVAVAVPKHLVDLALHKPAMQFDTAYGGVASRAVDGVINQNYGARHCTCTNVNTRDRVNKNWWAVDLSRKSSIHTVVVYNRADCCGNRLANFDVVVSDRRPAPGRKLVYSRSEVCAHKTGALRQGGHEAFRCQRDGRYVAIVQSRANYLTLCEVEVLGYPSTGINILPKVENKPPAKPTAPTKLTKSNLKKGGKFDLTSVFKGLTSCPKGTKTVGDACEITHYQFFITWLKEHAKSYHIDFERLPIVTTTTTTTSNQFSVGQRFGIGMFRGHCPSGTKTVGKFCEVNDVNKFLAWLKVNAKAYDIDYQVESAEEPEKSEESEKSEEIKEPAVKGGNGNSVTTTTTTTSNQFSVGQRFGISMFRGHCPSGTKTVGKFCEVNDVDKFLAWLKVNAKAYDIEYQVESAEEPEKSEESEKSEEIKEPAVTTTTTTTSNQFSVGQRFGISMFRGHCPSGTKTVGKFCEENDVNKFLAWLKVNAKAYNIEYQVESAEEPEKSEESEKSEEIKEPAVTTTTTTTSNQFSVGQRFGISMFRGHCPSGTKTVGKFCEVNDVNKFLAWLKVNAKAYDIEYQVESAEEPEKSEESEKSEEIKEPAVTTTTTTTSNQFSVGQRFGISMFRGHCPSGTKTVGKFCEVNDVNKFFAWLKVNAKAYDIEYQVESAEEPEKSEESEKSEEIKEPAVKGGNGNSVTTTTTTTSNQFSVGQRFDISMFGGHCPSGTKTVGKFCEVNDVNKFLAWLKVNAKAYNIEYQVESAEEPEKPEESEKSEEIKEPAVTTTTTTTSNQFSVGQRFGISMFRGHCPSGTKTVGKFCEVNDVNKFLAWLKVNAKAYDIEYQVESAEEPEKSEESEKSEEIEEPAAGSTTSYTTTTTTEGGSGFAVGQDFPNTMFEGTCVSGTVARGSSCVVNDAEKFTAWLKKNGEKYGISVSESKK
ncbi:uncharacterized protein LOC135497657 [Lineus longissimus]|uniref:uncharacterized protein LOC135497657 n=1 Tax=Lineus longissimus TaxID=88925 RepID=UPI00315D6249